jgi:propanol-preferring alcohol dehydrogenase
MAQTMAAWQWVGHGKAPERVEVSVPRPGPGEVLIHVAAAGLCHTDVGVIDEPTWEASVTKRPVVLGHEIAGVIAAVGPDVTQWKLGSEVAVCPSGVTVPGFSRDGGYAAYSLAPIESLVAVPQGLDLGLASVATDAGMTSHHAVVGTGAVTAGMRVGIIGIGGLGQFGAQIAVAQGAEVFVADVNPAARKDAESWGLSGIYASAEELVGLGLDVVVDFAGFGSTTSAALRAIRVGGRVVMVGLGAEDTTLKTREVVHQRAEFIGL